MSKLDNVSNFGFSGLVDTRDSATVEFDFDTFEDVTYKFPNVDYLYGPYDSKQEAFDKLSEVTSSGNDALVVGKTVGVVENGSIVEYWFKSACSSVSDLVKKNSGGSGISGDLVATIDPNDEGTLILSVE